MSRNDAPSPQKPVLDYAAAVPAPLRKSWLIRSLAVLLVAYVLLLAALGVWARAWGIDPLVIQIVLLVFLLTQALFLSSAPHWTWPKPRRRRSMVAAFGLGTLLGAALTVGLLASLLSLVYLMGLAPRKLGEDAGVWLLVLIPAASWALWLAVFGTMLRRQHWGSVYPRLYLTLLAGSWLELLITIPIDVQVRKRTSCYCGEGTFLGLTVGLTMVLWTFGPGVALLYLARRQQRRQAAMPLNDARSL